MFPAFISGSIAAAVGAAAWWAVAAFFSYEHSIVAWVIGGLVGFAVARANHGFGSQSAGVLAAVLAVMSITVGKYMAYETFMPTVDALVGEYADVLENNDELLTSYIADDVAEEMEGAGKSLNWPPLPEDEVPDEEAEYPPAVWSAAMIRWEGMSQEDRDGRVADILRGYEGDVAATIAVVRAEADFFSTSFGAFDILFLGLAVVTAFRMAAGGLAEEELVPAGSPASNPPPLSPASYSAEQPDVTDASDRASSSEGRSPG